MRPLRRVVNRFEVWTRLTRQGVGERGSKQQREEGRERDRQTREAYLRYQVIREMRK